MVASLAAKRAARESAAAAASPPQLAISSGVNTWWRYRTPNRAKEASTSSTRAMSVPTRKAMQPPCQRTNPRHSTLAVPTYSGLDPVVFAFREDLDVVPHRFGVADRHHGAAVATQIQPRS